MKKFTLILSMVLVVSVLYGQSLVEKRTTRFLQQKGDIEYSRDLEVIWSDDFSDADLWVTDYDDQNANDGPWVIGTDGPAGYYSEAMGAIESTTGDNGFAMYDSDGTGVEVGSQDSKLIYHTAIDCGDYDKVAVTFESYYRKFHGVCYVEISTDSTNWTQYQVHEDVAVNSATSNPEIVTINITDVAANQETVYFMFRYVGEWDYAWMVDDVKFFVAPDHDLKVVDARVNFFQYPHYIDSATYPVGEYYGFSGFFGMIPQRQIANENALMVFDGVVKNLGSMDATPTFSINVTDPSSDVIFSNDVVYDDVLGTSAQDTMSIIDTEFHIDAPELGTYTWTFETSEDGITEENPADNTITYTTEVTENLYTRDNGMYTGGVGTENFVGGGLDGDIVGVVYPFFEPDTIVKGRVFLSSMTALNTSFVFKIMTWDEVADEWVELTSSSIITVDDSTDLEVMLEIEFPDYVPVEPIDGFTEVLAAVEIYPGGESFRIGIDNTAPTSGYETWMYFMDDLTWYTYGGEAALLIQLELKGMTSVGQNTYNDFEVYPNPTNGVIRIENVKDATVEVFDMLGKRVAVVDNAEYQTSIDLGAFAEGSYIVRVTANEGVGMRKVNLIK
jgi:hypothetical protein